MSFPELDVPDIAEAMTSQSDDRTSSDVSSPEVKLDTTSISIEDIRPMMIEETKPAVNNQNDQITNGICELNNDDLITDLSDKKRNNNAKKNNLNNDGNLL